MKLDYPLTPYIKISSNIIKDINVVPDTIILLEENIGRTLSDINCNNIFFNSALKIMEIKKKKCGLVKVKSFCTVNNK